MSWTPEQQEAIQAENDILLVSAAAGSGKTAVLVERVIALLRKGASLDRMLIVTFTRAAAAEMRERIEAALSSSGEEALAGQAARVGRARISTLHAFCQRFLREHFSLAEIDPAFRLASEAELAPLWEAALEETLGAAWRCPDEDEKQLFEQFEYDDLETLLPALRSSLLAHRDPFGWARGCLKPDASVFLEELNRISVLRLHSASACLEEMEDILTRPGAPLRYETNAKADRALMDSLLKEGLRPGIVPGFSKLSTKRASEEEDPALAARFKALREDLRKAVRDAAAVYPASPEAMEKAYALSLPVLRALIGLCEKADRAFSEKKSRRNCLDFSDLEHLTLKVLSDPAARLQAAGAFDDIFVDEYQDVSGIQESVITALHLPGKNRLFLVGDVKQSIYRFRSADPTLFMDRYARSSPDRDARSRKILLNANFRSSPAILSCVNLIFRHAMRRDVTEIEYDEEAALRPGIPGPEGDPVRIVVFRPPDGEDAPEDPLPDSAAAPAGEDGGEEDPGEAPSAWLREAWWTAREIRRLIDGQALAVPEGKGSRPLRYRDIVILLRNAQNRSRSIAEVLESQGIPVYSDADARYFDLPEVRDMNTLLKCIVNPLSDVELLGALASPCFDFTGEELALVRLSSTDRNAPFHQVFLGMARQDSALGKKCRGVLETLDRWRFLSRNMPLDSFLWTLSEESGLYLRSGAAPSPENARARLRLFPEQAQGDQARMSLADFVQLLENARKTGDSVTAKSLSDSDDVVRIMTLHKSKGLQFPVVFMLENARAFRAGREGNVLVDDTLGPACRVVSPGDRVLLPNPALSAIAEKNKLKQKAEEARLMYVGMTRARQRLYFLGSPRNPDAALGQRRATPASAVRASSMLDFVLDALGGEGLTEGEKRMPDGAAFQILLPPALFPRQTAGASAPGAPVPDTEPETVPLPFGRGEGARPPLKTSVTSLARLLQEERPVETPADKRTEFRQDPPDRPRFLMEEEALNGSERGTLIHRCLGALDPECCRRGDIAGGLERLIRKGLFSAREVRFLRDPSVMDRLAAFYASPVGRRMLLSPRVQREWAFNLHLNSPLADYLQGVIDLCFLENGQWVLCDYKTDRLDADSLVRRYREQIGLYRLALERITGLPVKETLLYSLHLGREIPLPPSPGA